MRILFDHEFFNVFKYSGITRYFYEIISRISAMPDARVSVFMGFHLNKYGLEKHRSQFDRFFAFHRPSIPKTGRLFHWFNNAAFPVFGSLARPQLYHQTYYSYLFPSFKGRRVVTVYDMTYELFPEFFSATSREVNEKRQSVERADAIIAISESTRNDLIRLWGIPADRIRTIHLAGSLKPPRVKGPPPIERPYILYVGQRVLHKNFGALLKMYCSNTWLHKEFNLLCFGGAPFNREEMEMARSHGVANRLVHLVGTDFMLASVYQHATALVYPSFNEGFGLPVLEAMELGCPAVLSRTSSLPEVGGDAALYFDPLDKEEMAQQVKRVVMDGGFRQSMREKGLLRATGFSWNTCARETAALYREIIGGSGEGIPPRSW